MGCDLAVLIDAQQQVGIEAQCSTNGHSPYVDVVFPKMIDLRRLNVYKEVDFGRWYMFAAATSRSRMTRSARNVNVSGGAGSTCRTSP